jgi:Flp pilus assembly protein CpaB
MRKLNLTILAGLVLALIGATTVFAYGRNVDAKIRDGRETVRVLVATKPIDAGTAATAVGPSVKVRQVPRAYVADGALTDLDAVSTLALRGPVAKGAQLTRDLFAPAGTAFTAVKPGDGNVALAIDVGLTPGVAGYLSPGSAVDIFVTFAAKQQTKLFATGVRVLSVSVAPPPGGDEKDGTQSQGLAIVDVSPAEAERIVNAATLGKLYLALSTSGEKHVTPGAVPQDSLTANR